MFITHLIRVGFIKHLIESDVFKTIATNKIAVVVVLLLRVN